MRESLEKYKHQEIQDLEELDEILNNLLNSIKVNSLILTQLIIRKTIKLMNIPKIFNKV